VSGDRFVVLGLAHVRSPWFTDVARWATSGVLPIEFVKCVSAEQVRAQLESGRPFSATLLDARLHVVDRDLIAAAARKDVPVIVVHPHGERRDAHDLGAAASLPHDLGRDDLLDALVTHCHPIDDLDQVAPPAAPSSGRVAWRAPLVAVTGRAGAGTSTVAIALAQGLGLDPSTGGDVVLVDLARHAHQALLHDAGDVVPGLQDLVDAHRSGAPPPGVVAELTYPVPDRGYRLLLGMRSPHDWVLLRQASFSAALEGLRTASRMVVADTDADIEGEADTGSFDIEDRNLVARTAIGSADVVVVVTRPTTTALLDLVRHLDDLARHGVSRSRTLVAVNRAPRRLRARAELARAIADLCEPDRLEPFAGPVFVGERRGIDEVHRDVAVVPGALSAPLAAAVRMLLDRVGSRSPGNDGEVDEPATGVRVTPGSLGSWAADDETDGRALDQ
jgi:MinD-like ATPase involved in chromosome partitioning or flagellar assembly